MKVLYKIVSINSHLKNMVLLCPNDQHFDEKLAMEKRGSLGCVTLLSSVKLNIFF